MHVSDLPFCVACECMVMHINACTSIRWHSVSFEFIRVHVVRGHYVAFNRISFLFHSVLVKSCFIYVSFFTRFIHRPLHSTTPPHSSAFQAVFILTLYHLHRIFFILKRLHPRRAPFSKDHLTLVAFKCILVHSASVAFLMWCICIHSRRMARCAAF